MVESGISRRAFLRHSAGALAAGGAMASAMPLWAQSPGERPPRDESVQVLLPRTRVPVSLIIDDSTCLVNLNRFAVPQFAETFNDPKRYTHPWQKWPVEIPDEFVRSFALWCAEHGVKGKYSVVPYPACVGRLDRIIPGWTSKQLAASIDLVRKEVMPNWDIHPEMVTHTRVIDTKTGHPYADHGPRFMENWDWTTGRSADELTDYLSYALKILKNVDLPCEGITTPGGFGNRALPQLAEATFRSCRDVFSAEVPHYFRHLYDSGNQSVSPRVELSADLDTANPKCVVSIIGCTGDWTGGWDCSDRGELDRFITPDLAKGRLVDVIERGEPAVLVCHWTGIYWNGEEVGFEIFREVVRRLHEKYDHLVWMKLSEISRYWAAKELTRIERAAGRVTLTAPFAAPTFTLSLPSVGGGEPIVTAGGRRGAPPREVRRRLDLVAGTWLREKDRILVAFDLRAGQTTIDA